VTIKDSLTTGLFKFAELCKAKQSIPKHQKYRTGFNEAQGCPLEFTWSIVSFLVVLTLSSFYSFIVVNR
jgi:hypothetical protein